METTRQVEREKDRKLGQPYTYCLPWGYETWEEYHADCKAVWDSATVEELEWYRKTAKRLLGIDD